MSRPFTNNVVVITGASSGIGAEMARQLADQGAKLVLAARRAVQLEAVAAECRSRGGEALIVPTDVTDEGKCRALIEAAVAHYGRIDTLIANAGTGEPRNFENMPDLDQIRCDMDLNFYGVVACVHYALPHIKLTRGRIMGISSLIGILAVPSLTGYVSAKHAMAGFLDTLRIELRESGVSITVIYPGAVLIDKVHDMAGEQIRNAQLMTVEECARLSLKAAAKRRRQVVMTAQGKLARWIHLIAPDLLDRFAAASMRENKPV
jgi:short-subunit dehydrogenase